MKAAATMIMLLIVFVSGCNAEAQATEKNEGSGNEISCPSGFTDDPSPGSCRVFTDSDKNGICDLSE